LPTSAKEIAGAFLMSDIAARTEPPAQKAKRGPGRPRAQPLEQQRRQVLDAALAVFAQQGYHGATIEAVARGSGTPRPTVYELFGGKDDLFEVVVDEASDRVVAHLSASFTESEEFSLEEFVRHNFAAVFDLFEQEPDAVRVLLNAEQGTVDRPTAGPAEMRRRVLHEVTEFTRSRWEELGIDIGESAEVMALIFFRMAEGLAIRRATDDSWDREAFIDLLTEFTLGGINQLWSRSLDVLVAAGRRTGHDAPDASTSEAPDPSTTDAADPSTTETTDAPDATGDPVASAAASPSPGASAAPRRRATGQRRSP